MGNRSGAVRITGGTAGDFGGDGKGEWPNWPTGENRNVYE